MRVNRWLTVAAIGVIGIISGTAAYFTSTDVITNSFTGGSVDIELIEAVYDTKTDADRKLNPGASADKDPLVKNTGKNPAYVFLRVTIPAADVRVLKDTKEIKKTDKVFYEIKENQELYQLIYNSTVGTNTSKWIPVSDVDLGDHTYLFAYMGGNETEMAELAVGESTEVLFDHLKFIDNLYAWKDDEILDRYAYEYSLLTEEDDKNAYWKSHQAWLTETADVDRDKFEKLAKKVPKIEGQYIQNDTLHIQVDAFAVQCREIEVADKTPKTMWKFLQTL
ncbi:MAG: SipW-dependent-type signal peptide-containing protein [Ruminococcus sp.]|nr:SipW-dependent-type signal peptide-containing protein [Ruminococcus sp.]